VHIWQEGFSTKSTPAAKSCPSRYRAGTRSSWVSTPRLLSTVCVHDDRLVSSSTSVCVTYSSKVTVVIRPMKRAGYQSSTVWSPEGTGWTSGVLKGAPTSGGVSIGGTGQCSAGRSKIRCWEAASGDWLGLSGRWARLSNSSFILCCSSLHRACFLVERWERGGTGWNILSIYYLIECISSSILLLAGASTFPSRSSW
jgi:hypothetical protein